MNKINSKKIKRKLDIWNGDLPPALTPEQNLELLREYKKSGDKSIRNQIIEGNLRFVVYYVNRYCKKYLNQISVVEPSFEDLYQMGALGLIRAVKTYNTDLPFAFNTYVGKSIYRTIQTYNRLNKSIKTQYSLNATNDDNDDEAIKMLPSETNLEENIANYLDANLIKNVILPKLNPKNAEIFYKYYFERKTLQEIADEGTLTRERIRQIIKATKEQVLALYENPSNANILINSNFYNTKSQKRYEKNQKYIQKYGKEFLVNYVFYKLNENQGKVLKNVILNYDGVAMRETAQKLNLSESTLYRLIYKIYDILDENGEQYYQEYLSGKSPKSRQKTLQQKNKSTAQAEKNIEESSANPSKE